MANANDAAEAIRRLVLQNEQLGLAVSILDEFGSFENAVVEAKRRCAAANAEADAAQETLNAAKQAVKAAKQRADDILAKANTIAEDVQQAAMSKSNDILTSAKMQAEQIKADAQTVADARVNGVSSQVSQLTEKKAVLELDIGDAQARRSAANALAEDAEVRLAKVKEQITKLSAA